MPQWLTEDVLWLLASLSGITFVVSLLSVPWLVARIPADYFVLRERRRAAALAHRPLLRLALRALANLAGVLLIAAGIAMLVLPGQGIITIIVGMLLTDFPGKYRFERWLVSLRSVHRPINALRRRAGRGPLLLPQDVDGPRNDPPSDPGEEGD